MLDVSTVLAGPLCCQLLGDFGADVIKVEHPDGGDSLRTHGPTRDGVPLWWKVVGRNKRSVGLLLSEPEGAEVFLELVRTADIVVEGFRPGTLERWGLGEDRLRAVNPGLVLVRVSGFGQHGPARHRPGFGTLAEAMSGFAASNGDPSGPPMLPPLGLADSIAAMAAALAAVLGLYHRDAAAGPGQSVDVSVLEPIITALGPGPTIFDQLGVLPRRVGNRSESNAPRNVYRAADGRWIAVSASTTSIAARVLRLVGHGEMVDEPWFANSHERAAHGEEIDAAVAAWVGSRPAEEVLAGFHEASAAAAPVHDVAALLDDPQILALDAIPTIEDAELGPLRMPGLLFRMSETPGSIRSTGAPLGAHTDEVLLGDLGLDPDRVQALRDRGVIA